MFQLEIRPFLHGSGRNLGTGPHIFNLNRTRPSSALQRMLPRLRRSELIWLMCNQRLWQKVLVA